MTKQVRLILILVFTCLLLSMLSIGFNAQVFHFIGNNYFPLGSFQSGMSLILLFISAYYQLGQRNKITQIFALMLAYYGIFVIESLATNAVQYTPFATIDQDIVKLEPIPLLPIVIWTKQHPGIRQLLAHIYNSLTIEMIVLPLLLILNLKREHLYEYFILLLLSTIVGFGFYYFFPSSGGPAATQNPEYFATYQHATELKFYEIHHHMKPSTLEGGMIALPSFHAIWAWLLVYAIRPFRRLYWILMPYNALIIVSCIMLGWHYFTDIFGSILVLVMVHGFCIMHRTTAKWSKSSGKNHACVQ